MASSVGHDVQVPPFATVRRLQQFGAGFLIPEFVRRVVAGVPVGTFLTSWWRSPAGNFQVGGSSESQHLWAAAADLGGDIPEIARGLRRQGLIVVEESDHVHAQAWPAGTARRIGLLRALGLA